MMLPGEASVTRHAPEDETVHVLLHSYTHLVTTDSQ